MSDLSKKFMSIIKRVDEKSGCRLLQAFVDEIGEERSYEILDLAEGMIRYKNYVTEREAMNIVDNMVNFDNSKGAKWSPDDVKNAIASIGGKCEMDGEYNWWSMYVTIEMVHSDEWGVLKNIVEPSKEAAVCYELAKAKLLDKDGIYNVRTYFQL